MTFEVKPIQKFQNVACPLSAPSPSNVHLYMLITLPFNTTETCVHRRWLAVLWLCHTSEVCRLSLVGSLSRIINTAELGFPRNVYYSLLRHTKRQCCQHRGTQWHVLYMVLSYRQEVVFYDLLATYNVYIYDSWCNIRAWGKWT